MDNNKPETTWPESEATPVAVPVCQPTSTKPVTASEVKKPETPAIPDPEVEPCSVRRSFTRAEKLRILAAAEQLQPGEMGAFLRREGVYSSYLHRWKKEKEQGILDRPTAPKKGRPANPQEQNLQDIAKLRADNLRLQGQLKKAELIIDIQKKVWNLLELEV